MQEKEAGLRLYLITGSELVYSGLMGQCARWQRQGWVGFRGLLAHVDLWEHLWAEWCLLGDSVTIQWFPEYVRVDGHEAADERILTGGLPSRRA